MELIQETIPRQPVPSDAGRAAALSPASQTVLRIDGLTKRFGPITAVDGLTLEVRAGEVVGLLGPNGAGKTTTVGMILGLVAPDAGRIELLGRDVNRHRSVEQRNVGAIVESPAFYPFLSGRDNLQLIALAAGGVPAGRIESLLGTVGLTERASSKYKTYSLGMKQRLGIASTLLTDPPLVILDEPTNGLDPAGQREVRELIPRLAQEGHTVLLASHLLYEVQQIANRVVIVRRGKLVASGTVADLLRRESGLDIMAAEPERAADVLRTLPFVREVTVRDGSLAVTAPIEQGADVSRALAEHGLYPAAMVPRTSSLEDVFLELTELPGEGSESDAGAATK